MPNRSAIPSRRRTRLFHAAFAICAAGFAVGAHAAQGLDAAIGGGLGAAAGTAIGQQVGGSTGGILGGAVGGAVGGAAATRGPARNGAMVGGALGGASGAAVGGSMGGGTGAVLGSGVGGAAGAAVGAGITAPRPSMQAGVPMRGGAPAIVVDDRGGRGKKAKGWDHPGRGNAFGHRKRGGWDD